MSKKVSLWFTTYDFIIAYSESTPPKNSREPGPVGEATIGARGPEARRAGPADRFTTDERLGKGLSAFIFKITVSDPVTVKTGYQIAFWKAIFDEKTI